MEHIVRLEHGEPDFGEATNPAAVSYTHLPFSTANIHKEKALNGLTSLKSLYQEAKAPNALAITTLLIRCV